MPSREVVLLAQQDREAAAGGVARDAGAVDAAADHEEVNHLGLRSSSSSFMARLVWRSRLASARGGERLPDRHEPRRACGRPGTGGRRGGELRIGRLGGAEERRHPFGDAGVHRGIGADRDRRHHRRAGGAGLLAR